MPIDMAELAYSAYYDKMGWMGPGGTNMVKHFDALTELELAAWDNVVDVITNSIAPTYRTPDPVTTAYPSKKKGGI